MLKKIVSGGQTGAGSVVKKILTVAIPVVIAVTGWLIIFKVGSGVTINGSWREFGGALLIAVGVLSEVAAWITLLVKD